jgi:hypothetical protein
VYVKIETDKDSDIIITWVYIPTDDPQVAALIALSYCQGFIDGASEDDTGLKRTPIAREAHANRARILAVSSSPEGGVPDNYKIIPNFHTF